MRTETKEKRTDRFSVADPDGERYTISEVTEFTQSFPEGGPPSAWVPGRVRYECADTPLTLLDSGEFDLHSDPPKRVHRVD